MVQPLGSSAAARMAQFDDGGAAGAGGATPPATPGIGGAPGGLAPEKTQSWSECITGWLMAPVNSVVSAFRSLACVLTFGYCCNDKRASWEDILKDVKAVVELYGKADVKDEDKHAAFDKLFADHTHLKAEFFAYQSVVDARAVYDDKNGDGSFEKLSPADKKANVDNTVKDLEKDLAAHHVDVLNDLDLFVQEKKTEASK